MDDWMKIIAVLSGLVMATIPLWVPRWLEPFLYNRSVKQARLDLADAGLTPEEYIATIDTKNTLAMAAAKVKFGLY